MRTHALLSMLALSAVLAAPPLAGAADRHPSSRGGHGDYRSSHGRDNSRSYRPRPAPRGHYAPSHRPAPGYRYAPRPRYRYYRPGYAYRPYYATPYYPAPYYTPAPGYYRTYPPVYAAPYPGPGRPYGYAPYRGGVHGGVSLGFPGFGLSLYF